MVEPQPDVPDALPAEADQLAQAVGPRAGLQQQPGRLGRQHGGVDRIAVDHPHQAAMQRVEVEQEPIVDRQLPRRRRRSRRRSAARRRRRRCGGRPAARAAAARQAGRPPRGAAGPARSRRSRPARPELAPGDRPVPVASRPIARSRSRSAMSHWPAAPLPSTVQLEIAVAGLVGGGGRSEASRMAQRDGQGADHPSPSEPLQQRPQARILEAGRGEPSHHLGPPPRGRRRRGRSPAAAGRPRSRAAAPVGDGEAQRRRRHRRPAPGGSAPPRADAARRRAGSPRRTARPGRRACSCHQGASRRRAASAARSSLPSCAGSSSTSASASAGRPRSKSRSARAQSVNASRGCHGQALPQLALGRCRVDRECGRSRRARCAPTVRSRGDSPLLRWRVRSSSTNAAAAWPSRAIAAARQMVPATEAPTRSSLAQLASERSGSPCTSSIVARAAQPSALPGSRASARSRSASAPSKS